MSTEEFAGQILMSLQSQLKDQWDSIDEKDKALVEKVAKRGAKLAAAEARGDTAYVAEHTEAFEGMVKNLEAGAAIETATFCNALLDTGIGILVTVGKKLLGLPG